MHWTWGRTALGRKIFMWPWRMKIWPMQLTWTSTAQVRNFFCFIRMELLQLTLMVGNSNLYSFCLINIYIFMYLIWRVFRKIQRCPKTCRNLLGNSLKTPSKWPPFASLLQGSAGTYIGRDCNRDPGERVCLSLPVGFLTLCPLPDFYTRPKQSG